MHPIPWFLWISILGVAGFLAGFLGPIFFVPEANQGPLVGIFITGPGGALLGLLLFLSTRFLTLAPRNQWNLLYGSTTLLVVLTLISVLPGPAKLGEIVELQLVSCKKPALEQEASIQTWRDRIKDVQWVTAREGWEKDLRKIYQEDQGVILEAKILRQTLFKRHRKPWNKGKITSHPPGRKIEATLFYLAEVKNSCASFTPNKNYSFFIPHDFSVLSDPKQSWPPQKIARLLLLHELQPIPAEIPIKER